MTTISKERRNKRTFFKNGKEKKNLLLQYSPTWRIRNGKPNSLYEFLNSFARHHEGCEKIY